MCLKALWLTFIIMHVLLLRAATHKVAHHSRLCSQINWSRTILHHYNQSHSHSVQELATQFALSCTTWDWCMYGLELRVEVAACCLLAVLSSPRPAITCETVTFTRNTAVVHFTDVPLETLNNQCGQICSNTVFFVSEHNARAEIICHHGSLLFCDPCNDVTRNIFISKITSTDSCRPHHLHRYAP